MTRRTALCLLGGAVAAAQDADGDRARGMWNSEFRAARVEQPTAQRLRPSNRASAPAAEAESTMVGLTLWRFEEARQAAEDRARVLLHEESRQTPWHLRASGVEAPVREGDRVRLGFECSQKGYLYVATRETYRDGSMSPAFLAFPSHTIAGGFNEIAPGRVCDIPGWSDDPPYLTFRKSRPDHIAETLMVMLSPIRIEGLIAGRQPLPIPLPRLREWQAHALNPTARAGTGSERHWMSPHQLSASKATGSLRPNDPAPGSIFVFRRKQGSPIYFTTPIALS